MLSNLSADSDFFICSICKDEFNHTNRTPRMIPVCGHTFCSECIIRLINPQNQLKCPLDQILCTLQKKSIEFFPTNILLKQLVEHRTTIKADLCEVHEDELKNLVCMTDQKKICKYCVDYGEHASHDVRYIKDVQMLADNRRKKLEGVVGEINTENRSRENLFRTENESLVNIIKGRFVRVRVELEKQEQEVLKKTAHFLNEIKERTEDSSSVQTAMKIKEKLEDKISALKDAKFDRAYFEALKESEIRLLPKDDHNIIREVVKDFKESLAEELDEMNTQMIAKLKEYNDISLNESLFHQSGIKREEFVAENLEEMTEKYQSDSSSEGEFEESDEEEEEKENSLMNRENSFQRYIQQQHPEFEYCGFIQHGQDLRRLMANQSLGQRNMTQPNYLQISGFRPIGSKRAFDELPAWSYSQGNDGGDHEMITKRLFLRQGGEEMFENRSADFSQYFTQRVNLNNLFNGYRKSDSSSDR